jgi:protein pelota
MIVKQSDASANALLVIPEDSDDLLTLRRVVAPGDYAIADTTRVVKQESDYGRPDRGERVKVRLTIRVDRIELDSSVDRLRVSGTITHTSNELVSKGVHHALSVQAGDILTVDKGRKWQDMELKLLRRSGDGSSSSSFILVAIDTQEAAVARITGTHVKIIPNIYSGQHGKRYPTTAKNASLDSFFADAAKTVASVLSEGDRIIVFGPGETRRRFYNALDRNGLPKERAQVVDGVDVAGEDGVFVFLRSPAMKEAMSASKLATVSAMLDQVMLMVNKGENKYAVGLKDITDAANIKAIEAIIFSDSVFKTADEEAVVRLLNSVESYGARTYAVDSSTDIGLRVSSLGGMVALLRYAMR